MMHSNQIEYQHNYNYSINKCQFISCIYHLYWQALRQGKHMIINILRQAYRNKGLGQLGIACRLRFMFKKYVNVRQIKSKNQQDIAQNSTSYYTTTIQNNEREKKIKFKAGNFKNMQAADKKVEPSKLHNKNMKEQQIQGINQLSKHSPDVVNPSQRNKMGKQSHIIFKTIKNNNRISQLFDLLRKYDKKIRVQQCLALLQQVIYLDNLKIRGKRRGKHTTQAQKDKNHEQNLIKEQNFDMLVDKIQTTMFKTAHTPEIYIKYIQTISKTQNQYLYKRSFPTLMKIIKNQFNFDTNVNKIDIQSTPVNQIDDTKQDYDNTDEQTRTLPYKQQVEKQEKIETREANLAISEVVSLQNNIKLLQSLLRICNRRSPIQVLEPQAMKQHHQQTRNNMDSSLPKSTLTTNSSPLQNYKLIYKLIKQVAKFVHVPTISNQVQNKILWQLIVQYGQAYPKLKLGKQILSSIVRDCLARVKREAYPIKKYHMNRKNNKFNKNKSKNKQINTNKNEIKNSQVNSDADRQNQNNRDNTEFNVMNEIPESHKVSSVNKLLHLQKLLLQQTRRSSLLKQIRQTKQIHMQNNLFFRVQHKLGKYISIFLPECQFYSQQFDYNQNRSINQNNQKIPQTTQQNWKQNAQNQPKDNVSVRDTLFSHIQTVKMLIQHINLLFVQLNMEVISKCDLIGLSYSQYQAVCTYVGNIILNVSQRITSGSGQSFSHKNYINKIYQTQQLLFLTCHLLHNLLSPQIITKMPHAVVHKSVNQNLLEKLFKQFEILPVDIQIIIIQYILRMKDNKVYKYQTKLVPLLISTMLSSVPNNQTITDSDNRHAKGQKDSKIMKKGKHFAIWYCRLLLGNKSYLQIVKGQFQPAEQQMSRIVIKRVMASLCQYEQIFGAPAKNGSVMIELGLKIGWYMRNISENQKIHKGLQIHYNKQSISNCLFTVQEVSILKQSRKYFSSHNIKQGSNILQNTKNQSLTLTFNDVSKTNILQMKKELQHRIDLAYYRVQLMLTITTALYSNKNTGNTQIHTFQQLNTSFDISQIVSRDNTYKSSFSTIIQAFKKEKQLLNYPNLLHPKHQQINKFVSQFQIMIQNNTGSNKNGHKTISEH